MKKLLHFIQTIIWLALTMVALFGFVPIDAIGCPAHTFMSGSVASESWTWPFLFRMMMAGAASFLVSNVMLYFICRVPALQGQFARDNPHFDLRTAVLRAVIVTPLACAAMFVATFDRLCVSPVAISDRHYLWSDPSTERWEDVVMVATACRRGSRGSWRQAYLLIFRDRRAIDLAGTSGPIAAHRQDIFAALHGRSFIFDARWVDPDCIEGFRDMATTRP